MMRRSNAAGTACRCGRPHGGPLTNDPSAGVGLGPGPTRARSSLAPVATTGLAAGRTHGRASGSIPSSPLSLTVGQEASSFGCRRGAAVGFSVGVGEPAPTTSRAPELATAGTAGGRSEGRRDGHHGRVVRVRSRRASRQDEQVLGERWLGCHVAARVRTSASFSSRRAGGSSRTWACPTSLRHVGSDLIADSSRGPRCSAPTTPPSRPPLATTPSARSRALGREIPHEAGRARDEP